MNEMEPNVIIPLKEYERLKEEASKILINEIKVKEEPSLDGVRITFPPETPSEVCRKVINKFRDTHCIIDHQLGYSPELFVLSYDVRRQLAAYQDVLEDKERRLNSEIREFEEKRKKLKKSGTFLLIFWTVFTLIYLILVWTR